MSETRKLAATLVADVVWKRRFAGADEERTLARLRGLRSGLIDPAIAGMVPGEDELTGSDPRRQGPGLGASRRKGIE